MDRAVLVLLGLYCLAGLVVAQETTGGSQPLQGVIEETTTVEDVDAGESTESQPVPYIVSSELREAREFFTNTVEFFDYWISVVPWFALVVNSLAFFGWCFLGKADNVVRILLMALAFFDILSLISFMDRAIFFWTDYEFSLQQNTDGGCKYIQWVSNGARNVSAYIILCFTFDRFLSVWFPMKRRSFMTEKTVAIAMAVIIVLSFAAETYLPALLYHSNTLDRCVVRDTHEMSVFSSIFRNGLGFLLPMILVAVLNGLVVHRLWQYKHYLASDPADSGRTRKAEAQNRSLTVMLVTVSIFSFVVYLPKTILFYMMLDGAYDFKKDMVTLYNFYSAVYIVDAIAMLNYSCNFFFYCLGAHRFRRLLKMPFRYLHTSIQHSRGRTQSKDLCA